MRHHPPATTGHPPSPGPADIVTCTFTNNDNPSTLTLVKTVTNDNGGTAAPTAWTLNAAGPTPITGATGSAAVTNANVNAGTYNLSRDRRTRRLHGGRLVLHRRHGHRGERSSANGANVTCTINNNDQAAQLTLAKTVTNDNGGTALPRPGPSPPTGPTPITGATGSGPVTNAPVNAGTYNLSESGAGRLRRRRLGLHRRHPDRRELVLPPAATSPAPSTTTTSPATLTLVKTVTNNNGGTAVPTAWTLAAAGPTPITGITGSPAVTNATVNAGNYTLRETGGPSGYAAGPWTCTGGTVTGATVVAGRAGRTSPARSTTTTRRPS